MTFLTAPRRRQIASHTYSLAGVAAFVGVWSFAAARSQPYVLPSPTAVGQRMIELLLDGEVLPNFLISFWRAVLGWVIAVLLGIVIGSLMGRYRYARAFFHDLIYLAANVPLIVYAIVAIILFGITGFGPTFVVVLFVLPSVALNVAAGVMSVDPDLVGMSKAFDRRPGRIIRHVVIPTVAPFAFAGGRVSFADSWKLAALVETFGGAAGVGYQIARSYHLFSVRDLLAWMMFFVIFVVLVERLLLVNIENRMFAWRNPVPARKRRYPLGRAVGMEADAESSAGRLEPGATLAAADAVTRRTTQ